MTLQLHFRASHDLGVGPSCCPAPAGQRYWPSSRFGWRLSSLLKEITHVHSSTGQHLLATATRTAAAQGRSAPTGPARTPARCSGRPACPAGRSRVHRPDKTQGRLLAAPTRLLLVFRARAMTLAAPLIERARRHPWAAALGLLLTSTQGRTVGTRLLRGALKGVRQVQSTAIRLATRRLLGL